ncbi:MAG: DUF5677 domain-containing protein, partial [Chloroflexota bacterium]
MPTQPLDRLLDREFSVVAARELIDMVSPLLVEIINYGTNVFARCATLGTSEPNEDLAPLMLYLHMLEFTDGIEALLRQSCVYPAIPLLRSCFEAYLQLEYILQDDGEYTNRSLGWLAHYARTRVKNREYFDPTSKVGTPIANLLRSDELCRNIEWPTPFAIKKDNEALSKLVRNMPKEAQGVVFQTEKLAKELSRYAQYTLLYRHWSSISHAVDVSRFIARSRDGGEGVRSLRNAEELL